MSSASVLRAWWTSQSMTGPEYMAEAGLLMVSPAGRTKSALPRLGLLQCLDLVLADLIGDRVMQDLDRRVNRCVGIRRDLARRLPDALHPRRVALLLRRDAL